MKKQVLYISLIIVLSGKLFGQTSDFKTWTGVSVEAEPVKNLNLEITPEVRLDDNSSKFQSFVTDVGVEYEVTKFLDLGLLYRHSCKYKPEDGYSHANRFSGYIVLSRKIERVQISYRALYEQEYIRMNTSEDGNIPEHMHRHKIGAKYNIRKNPITPELNGELFVAINNEKENTPALYRINTGASYKINKHWRVKLLYRFQKELNVNDPLSSHILSTNLQYSF